MPGANGGVTVSILVAPGGVKVQELARLEILAWGGEPTGQNVERRAARIEGELAEMGAKGNVLLVASLQGALAGVCRVGRQAGRQSAWLLWGLAILPSYWRCGIGRALVQKSIDHARNHGARVMRSETHADNTESIRFHEGVGFRNEGGFTAADGDEKVAFSLDV